VFTKDSKGMKARGANLLSLTALTGIVFFLAVPSWARSMRCGNELVRVGDPTIQLLQRCGEPDLKELLNTDGLIVEKWTYNCGSLRFMRIITLRGGVIRKIELADYGTGPPRCQ
jgi:hypothetical protein